MQNPSHKNGGITRRMNHGLRQICRELVKLAENLAEDLSDRRPETAPQVRTLPYGGSREHEMF
jgi:hypothetical protein